MVSVANKLGAFIAISVKDAIKHILAAGIYYKRMRLILYITDFYKIPTNCVLLSHQEL